MPRANVGHRSGKERNKFHRIMVKTTVVCFLKRLDINLKHMSEKVKSNIKGHRLLLLG